MEEPELLSPRYRICVTEPGGGQRPADESWWAGRPVHDDLDSWLGAHLRAPGSAERPLLLIGHPGAGKTLVVEALAGRMPAARLSPPRLPVDGAGTAGVLLVDGLHEPLQEDPARWAGYLFEVARFQAGEASEGRPTAVVVACRTIAVERLAIPDGTTVVKLEDFDDDQVAAWLAAWHAANAEAIAAGTVRPLTPAAALRRPELARRPLLLSLLARYTADPRRPAPDDEAATGRVYGNVLGALLEREPAEQGHVLRVAALGLFNRGRPGVTETELAEDLAALRVAGPGQRHPFADFLFTRVPGPHGYGFLADGFGDYLVAQVVVDALAEAAFAAFGRPHAHGFADDGLTRALLSHRPLATRPAVLAFARDLYATLAEPERDNIPHLLDNLMSAHRFRRPSLPYDRYRPRPGNNVRELAVYSANLVLLRVAFAGGAEVPLRRLFYSPHGSPAEEWAGTLDLWRAALDPDDWRATAAAVRRVGDAVVADGHPDPREDAGAATVFLSYCREDEAAVERIYQALGRRGLKVWKDTHDLLPGVDWERKIRRALSEYEFAVICLSRTAVAKRGFFQVELKVAARMQQERSEDDVYIIPVRIDAGLQARDLPSALTGLHVADLAADWDHGIEQVVRTIAAHR
ncbi:toll/interleukin-1 receptor domain-containing protein [Dactylosporangium salmoneum]|uniref:TIR domain-containing protein n=1 Tax=Dactylosporangium salmoneum TaxID=53361 RepID=A0ABN3FSL0_9ACTN